LYSVKPKAQNLKPRQIDDYLFRYPMKLLR